MHHVDETAYIKLLGTTLIFIYLENEVHIFWVVFLLHCRDCQHNVKMTHFTKYLTLKHVAKAQHHSAHRG